MLQILQEIQVQLAEGNPLSICEEIQSGALRQRTRGPANCLIGGAGRILIGLSCPNLITNIFGSDCHYEAVTYQGAVWNEEFIIFYIHMYV